MQTVSRVGRVSRASIASIIIHAAVFIALVMTLGPARESFPNPAARPIEKFVFLKQPGPGGGGGGSPAPAPPQPIEVPAHVSAVVPITPVELVPPPEAPPPTLNAPIETSAASLMRAAGTDAVALAGPGGGGRGDGLGPGRGPGVGPGAGGNFGGGIAGPGDGVSDPVPLRMERPNYTSEAMSRRIQGDVTIEAIVMPNGSVGDVRVVTSLDRVLGLDQEAMIAARKWVFRPARDRAGNAVPVKITMILQFRLH